MGTDNECATVTYRTAQILVASNTNGCDMAPEIDTAMAYQSAPRQLMMRLPDLCHLRPLDGTPVGYRLRAGVLDDAPALAALLTAAFEQEWTVERVNRELLQAPDVDTVYVVEAPDGTLAATASARLTRDRFPESGYLHWVGADPSHRGQRLGELVTLRVLHRFRELGCKDSVLETDDFRVPAIRIYLDLGYRPENVDPTHGNRWRVVLRDIAGEWRGLS